MLNQAKIKLKSLIYDDSGIAMAYTILVFLFFFMLCVSTYAMTENIRQKMELQNACDAAAYSGAVTQADMLSRIAVLNRALSWTYLHTNRRLMDYLVGEWADATRQQYNSDVNWVNANRRACDCGRRGVRGVNYYVSRSQSSRYDVLMRTTLDLGSNVGRRVDQTTLLRDIATGRTNIASMITARTAVIASINNSIRRAARTAFNTTLGGDTSVGMTVLLNGGVNPNGPATYFLTSINENDFLAFSRYRVVDMGNGVNTWWVRGPSTTAIQRQYITGLTSSYWVHWERWRHIYPLGIGSYCNRYQWAHQQRTIPCPVRASSPTVSGTLLSPNFFGREGSIVVAAKRPTVNPFTSLFGTDAAVGLYGAFNGRAWDMWAVSASRAGIRLAGDRNGHYRVTYPGATFAAARYTDGVWNLCEEDWDAVMIPVARAWDNAWTGAPNANAEIDGYVLPSGVRVPGVREALSVATPYTAGVGDHIRH